MCTLKLTLHVHMYIYDNHVSFLTIIEVIITKLLANDGLLLTLYLLVLFCNICIVCTYVTGSEKTRPSGIFYILRNTIFKYSSHSGSLMLNCSAKFTA